MVVAVAAAVHCGARVRLVYTLGARWATSDPTSFLKRVASRGQGVGRLPPFNAVVWSAAPPEPCFRPPRSESAPGSGLPLYRAAAPMAAKATFGKGVGWRDVPEKT